jgi:hypothetical protein
VFIIYLADEEYFREVLENFLGRIVARAAHLGLSIRLTTGAGSLGAACRSVFALPIARRASAGGRYL